MPFECTECTFVVKVGGVDRPFIAIEPAVAGVDIAFPLKPGTTTEDAQELARQMRQMIESISLSLATEPKTSPALTRETA
jgi:hypothetical protein